jgi:hypothetical protein
MSTSVPETPHAVRAEVTSDELVVQLEDGRVVHVPLEWFPRLRSASDKDRNNLRLIGRGVGINWPDLDEDISVAGLLRPSLGTPHPSLAREHTQSHGG